MIDYEKIEKEIYEKLWQSLYGKVIKDTNHYSSDIPSEVIEPFLDFVKKNKIGGPLLDIGCGNGRHTILFAKNGVDCCGVDISSWAIKTAKEKNSNPLIKYDVGSVLNLAYNKNSFNIVVDFGCLHHLRKSQWVKYRKNILHVLRSGGIFLLYGFSINSGNVARFCPKTKDRNWTLRGKHYNHFFTDQEVENFFGKHFEIIEKHEIADDRPPLLFKVFYMRKF